MFYIYILGSNGILEDISLNNAILLLEVSLGWLSSLSTPDYWGFLQGLLNLFFFPEIAFLKT